MISAVREIQNDVAQHIRGRESWDWAEQSSLYKKKSPHKVGEETFVWMGARWRKQSAMALRRELLLLLLLLYNLSS